MIDLPTVPEDAPPGRLPALLRRWRELLQGSPFLAGRLVGPVVLVAGPNEVRHGLRRKAAGWVLVAPQGYAIVNEVPDTRTDTTLRLYSTQPVTLSLWVW